jgi:monofunctional biosynthetic peptidoglycan transglycosylase
MISEKIRRWSRPARLFFGRLVCLVGLNTKSVGDVLCPCVLLLVLGICLFWHLLGRIFLGVLGNEFIGFFRPWVIIAFSLFGLAPAILLTRREPKERFWNIGSRDIFLLIVAISGIASGYIHGSASSTEFLVFLLGFGLAKWVAFWVLSQKTATNRLYAISTTITVMLVLLSVGQWSSNTVDIFYYRDVLRWTGAWLDPNTYGLLMAVGILLAAGLLVMTSLKPSLAAHPFRVAVFALAAGSMVPGLLMSYSREAWIGFTIATIYLGWKLIRIADQSYSNFNPVLLHGAKRLSCFLKRNFVLLAACLISIATFTFYAFQNSESSFGRRVFSAANINDFSWRNRVAAYEGAFKIMAEKSWFGLGWNKAAPIYENFYQSTALAGAAVPSNDYLNLGSALGIPVLACFLAFIWLSLRGGIRPPLEQKSKSSESANTIIFEEEWLQTLCRGAVLILLIGFWFDGGLFDPALAIPFWCFLELAGVQSQPATSIRGRLSPELFAKTRPSGGRRFQKQTKKLLRRGVLVVMFLLLIPPVEVAYVRWNNPSTSAPMILRNMKAKFFGLALQQEQKHWEHINNASTDFLACVWVSEDYSFFQHHGFDWDAIKQAMRDAQNSGQLARGASTITQQCARSLFLWQSRSWVRKGLEAYYTLWMELLLSKERILELYINMIEMGEGIYGVEAASQHYFGVAASQLSREQAAMLAAIMPQPREWDPLHPNEKVKKRQQIILQRSENLKLPLLLDKKGS